MATIEKRTITKKSDTGTIKKETHYRVKVRLKGHAPETATFQLKADAVNWARKTETDMKEGRYFGHSKRHTLNELIDRYETSILPTLKGARDAKSRIKWWRKKAGHFLLSELTPEVVAQAKHDLAQTPKLRGGGKRTGADVNRSLAALSSLCVYAVKELKWLQNNPCKGISKFKESKGRTRFLTEDELPSLLKACRASKNGDLYLAVILSLTTGGRKSDVMALRWHQIDLKNRIALLGDTKNGDARSMPLSGEAYTLLQQRIKVRSLFDDRIFAPTAKAKKSPYIDLRKSWATARKEAKITDFRWHDLRHTSASYLTMGKATSLEIAKMLGHRSIATTLKYTHLSNEHLVEMGDKLAARFDIS